MVCRIGIEELLLLNGDSVTPRLLDHSDLECILALSETIANSTPAGQKDFNSKLRWSDIFILSGTISSSLSFDVSRGPESRRVETPIRRVRNRREELLACSEWLSTIIIGSVVVAGEDKFSLFLELRSVVMCSFSSAPILSLNYLADKVCNTCAVRIMVAKGPFLKALPFLLVPVALYQSSRIGGGQNLGAIRIYVAVVFFS